MRLAIVSDIPGNLAALEAVIADLYAPAPDLVVHVGPCCHWTEASRSHGRATGVRGCSDLAVLGGVPTTSSAAGGANAALAIGTFMLCHLVKATAFCAGTRSLIATRSSSPNPLDASPVTPPLFADFSCTSLQVSSQPWFRSPLRDLIGDDPLG